MALLLDTVMIRISEELVLNLIFRRFKLSSYFKLTFATFH